MTAHLIQIGPFKLARDVTIDYLLDSVIELLPVIRIRKQTKLQFRFFCIAKSSQ